MTKRTLFIIIGLLVLLNIAAIIIYLSAPNHEGKSPLDLSLEKSNEFAPNDSSYTSPSVDEFVNYNETVNYLSTDKVQDGNEKKRMSATVIVKLVWPKEINHSTQFMELENALMTKLTGKTYSDVKTMVKELTGKPKFVKPTTRYTLVNANYSTSHGVSHTTRSYTVKPHFSTHYRLEMEVIADIFDGHNTTRNYGIVHYDRMNGRIINKDDIFNSSATDNVVALINQSIMNMRMDNYNNDISEISSIPQEFVLGEKSVFFYVKEGSKVYNVSVSNKSLNPYFTELYRKMLSYDTPLVTYDTQKK